MTKLTWFLFLLIIALSVKAQTTGPYVVLTTVSDSSDSYYAAVESLAAYRNAQIIHFNQLNLNGLLLELQSIEPDYAAIVMKPIELDINFVRRFLMMSTHLDEDPFSDFSYGFITGATGTDALNFVNKIKAAEAMNIQNFPLNVGGWAASSINFVYQTAGDYISYLNPPNYTHIYMETSDSGSGHDFFIDNIQTLANNKLLDIGHNGDPHMLWLFEGGNSNPNPPVWAYDPAKIEDTAYARMGLTSYDLTGLNLYPAVAFNGACHAGEPKRVMVEGDIAATFGDTDWQTRFYTMSDTFSFALSILKTGITGYFAPCGANNANDQGEEVYNAFLFHEPLGDIHKRSIDGVVMGFLGNRPNLKLYSEGELAWGSDILPSGTFDPEDHSGAYSMLGGKANRIYFGDPLFNPFANNHSAELEITTVQVDSIAPGVLEVALNFDKPDVYEAYFPVWDKFHFNETRIYYPIELPESWTGEVVPIVIDSTGPYNLVIFAKERFRNKNILHVEVDIPDDMYEEIHYGITFRLGAPNLGIKPTALQDFQVQVYPNPASDVVYLTYNNPENQSIYLEVFDAAGRCIQFSHLETGNKTELLKKDLGAGLFSFRIGNQTKGFARGRFVIY
jgi:hypothetical protein